MRRLIEWILVSFYYDVPWCGRCRRELGILHALHPPVVHEAGDYEQFLRSLPR